MLRRLWRALLGPVPAPPPRLRDLIEQVDALEGAVNGVKKRVKVLEGQISGGERSNAGQTAREDAPGPTNDDQPRGQYPPRRPVSPTAELARRFKIGG